MYVLSPTAMLFPRAVKVFLAFLCFAYKVTDWGWLWKEPPEQTQQHCKGWRVHRVETEMCAETERNMERDYRQAKSRTWMVLWRKAGERRTWCLSLEQMVELILLTYSSRTGNGHCNCTPLFYGAPWVSQELVTGEVYRLNYSLQNSCFYTLLCHAREIYP